ncbi:MAG: ABC transporter ATP-binding protein [bacterium]|nr:ABC transporter ATP-binding protein [bacterium]
MTATIQAIDIAKTFKKKRSLAQLFLHPFGKAERVEALRGVSLEVRQGEIFGLLGPNGAGKTTLLKILSCLVLPDRGQALIAGNPTTSEYEVKRRIGLVHSDERSFYWRLSGRENLRFFARIYDLESRDIMPRIDELLRRVDMFDAADRPFSDYSSGMKQRMAIARALLHDPPILLMDEPTRSLDPASSLELRQFIQEELCARDGKTILITSHDLREIEALADRIAILAKGKVQQIGTLAEIKRWGVRAESFRLEVPAGAELPSGPYRVTEDETFDEVRRVTITLDDGVQLGRVLRGVLDEGVEVRACDRVESDLEQAFARLLKDAEGRE